jgi:NAD(P)-dependent dehydrogenase (short-subunit alcohol dehydrogenase family)
VCVCHLSRAGIGRFLSHEFAKQGATVICWSKSAGPNEEVVKEIRKNGGSAYAYTVDVADRMMVHNTAKLVRISHDITKFPSCKLCSSHTSLALIYGILLVRFNEKSGM